jgi:hypothetical protein
MRVELRAAGKTLAHQDVNGPLLLPPPGTILSGRQVGLEILEPVRGPAVGPDLLVGSVPLVSWNAITHSISVEFLEVPAPPPFEEDDVGSMWKAILDFPLPLASSMTVQGRGSGSATAAGQPLTSEALPGAISGCRRLLRGWPTSETRETIWRPADMRGGREDLRATDRLGARRGGAVVGSRVIPDRVARRQRGSVPWASTRLSGACRALAKYLRESGLDGSEQVLIRPLELVSERATPARRTPDPPLSSWPSQSRKTFQAVTEALVGLAVSGRGASLVPLSDVWRIYENWVALRSRSALENRFGQAEPIGDGTAWSCQWDLEGVVVRLHSQREIGSPSDGNVAGHPDRIISVSSNLRPDVLISITGATGDQALFCIDAKRRLTATEMDAGEVATAASKYLWGIRMKDDPDLLPVATALIVSSAGLAAVHDVERSRIFGLFALPSQGAEGFDLFVEEEVERLLAEVTAT